MRKNIVVKQVSSLTVASVSCIGSKQLPMAFSQLIAWATVKNLMQEQSKLLTIYHDSFKTTAADKVKMSAGIVLDKSIPVNSEIELITISAGKYIVGSYEIVIEAFQKTWIELFTWMQQHGHKFANTPPFEIYHNNFNEHPEKKAMVDFYIPIV